jgi:uncharacterized small protein (DUF1192 family)
MSDYEEWSVGALEDRVDALCEEIDHQLTTALTQVCRLAELESELKAIKAEIAKREADHEDWSLPKRGLFYPRSPTTGYSDEP